MKKTNLKFPVSVCTQVKCRYCGESHTFREEANSNEELISILDDIRSKGCYIVHLEFNCNSPF